MCLCVCVSASHFHVISNSNSDRNEINANFLYGFGYCQKYLYFITCVKPGHRELGPQRFQVNLLIFSHSCTSHIIYQTSFRFFVFALFSPLFRWNVIGYELRLFAGLLKFIWLSSDEDRTSNSFLLSLFMMWCVMTWFDKSWCEVLSICVHKTKSRHSSYSVYYSTGTATCFNTFHPVCYFRVTWWLSTAQRILLA